MACQMSKMDLLSSAEVMQFPQSVSQCQACSVPISNLSSHFKKIYLWSSAVLHRHKYIIPQSLGELKQDLKLWLGQDKLEGNVCWASMHDSYAKEILQS